MRHYGGPAFVNAINSLSLKLPRFAQGGVVHGPNLSRTVHMQNHFHGDSARAVGPMTWHAIRGAMR
ncbi:MAG TPA: hypothetical protein VD866_00790 [Urbifossiella sp.]|nr:hypothetical protein [Urbifossiella sp.]